MLLSAIKKLLHPISQKISPSAQKPKAETSEQEVADKMTENFGEILMDTEEIREENNPPSSESPVNSSETREAFFDDDEEIYGENEKTDRKQEENISGGRGHLTSSVPRSASVPVGAMNRQQMREARELFAGLDDGEIHRLYKKVTQ